MTVDSIFNETELSIFNRQTGFTFGDCIISSDGTILAVDRKSGQIFVGNELFRSNVHPLASLTSAGMENGQLNLKFDDSSSAGIDVDEGQAEAVMDVLRECAGAGPAPADDNDGQAADQKEELPLSGEELNETYSRLLNTGRNSAIGYLVAETGMSVKEACEYLDGVEGEKEKDEAIPDPDYHRDGTMTRKAILKTVKDLKPGDRIHLEFFPLIGKTRVYDTEYRRLTVDSGNSRYFHLYVSGDDFPTLMEEAADELFDYMEIHFFSEVKRSEISCRLKRVSMLKIIP